MTGKYLYMTSTNSMVLRVMMDNHMHIPFSFTAIATICFFLLTTLPQSHCQEESKYTVCSRPFNCGHISNISYPFWGDNRPSYCGASGQFELRCDANRSTLLQIGSQKFKVLNMDPYASHITMVRPDLVYDNCSSNLTSTSLDNSVFLYDDSVKSIFIFYNVTDFADYSGLYSNFSFYSNFSCKNEANRTAVYSEYSYDELVAVFSFTEPTEPTELTTSQDVDWGGGINDLKEALDGGFVVNYATPYDQDCFGCLNSKGECGMIDEYFTCHCPDGSDGLNCYGHSAPPPRSMVS